jgi:hypothetical protein
VTGQVSASQSREHVLDVVVHELTLLHRSRDHLNKALLPARRQGMGSPTTASELLVPQAACTPAQSQDTLTGGDSEVEGEGPHDAALHEPGPPAPADTAAEPHTACSGSDECAEDATSCSGGRLFPSSEECHVEGRTWQRASATDLGGEDGAPQGMLMLHRPPVEAASPGFYHMPSHVPILLIDSADGVTAMHHVIMRDLSSTGEEPGPVSRAVALDAEWRPYERKQPRTSVSILQVRSRSGRLPARHVRRASVTLQLANRDWLRV